MKGLTKNVKIGIIIILIIIILAIVVINPTGMWSAVEKDLDGGGGIIQYDMAIDDITWYPTNPTQNDNVAVQSKIENTGQTTIPSGSRVRFTLWYDGLLETTRNWTINTSMPPGGYNWVFLDYEYFTAGNHLVRVLITPQFTDNNPANNDRTETMVVTGNQSGNQTGNLNVTSSPSAASIYVDSVYKGVTPRLVTGLTAGLHEVRLTKTGYQDYITSVTIVAGQTTNLHAVLTPSGNQTSNPPTVNITASGPYNLTNSTGVMTLTAYAWDDVDLTNIKVYADGVLKRTCTLSGIQTYGTCTYTGIFSYGNHNAYATATDSHDQTTTSQTVYFIIP